MVYKAKSHEHGWELGVALWLRKLPTIMQDLCYLSLGATPSGCFRPPFFGLIFMIPKNSFLRKGVVFYPPKFGVSHLAWNLDHSNYHYFSCFFPKSCGILWGSSLIEPISIYIGSIRGVIPMALDLQMAIIQMAMSQNPVPRWPPKRAAENGCFFHVLPLIHLVISWVFTFSLRQIEVSWKRALPPVVIHF